jgi:integrase
MRRGEVLGLGWSDIDLDRGRLSVSQAVILVAYELIVSDIKTDNGRRTIDLDDRTVSMLRDWRKRQLEERPLVRGLPGSRLGVRPSRRSAHQSGSILAGL